MKFKLLLSALTVGVCTKMTAQVEDVSFFVTPTASYNWFDSKSTIKDGAMYGLQAGFGFGKGIELRGVYEQSSDLDQKFGQYANDLNDLGLDFGLTASDVKVRRVGGEFKANIPSGSLSPYFLVGTGVQTYKRKFSEDLTFKSENLYGSAGLGLKFNLAPRLTLNIEGRLFGYNMKPNTMLADPDLGSDDGQGAYEDWLDGYERKTMFNYSLNAGLQLYLGGTNDSNLSEMDRAYKQRFSSGLANFKVTLAPLGAYVDFDSESNYRKTYLLGGEIGVDFTDFVGLRGYFLQSTEDEEISFDFDKLSMYGADFVGRLNITRGIVPYVTVGGGYIDVAKDYLGEDGSDELSSKFYAKGGLGLDIPLGKRVDLFGAANILYTTEQDNSDVATVESTDQLRSHMMYNVGLRIKMSKSVDTEKAVDRAFDERFDPERREYENQLDDYNERIKDYDKKVAERDARIEKYKMRIDELEGELKEAFDNNDEQKASEIMREKKYLEDQMKKDEAPTNPLIRMTPAELENLIDKVIQDVDEEEDEKSVENRLDRLEELLLRMNQAQKEQNNAPYVAQSVPNQPTTDSTNATATKMEEVSANDRLVEEISKLQQRVNEQDNTIAELRDSNINRSNDQNSGKVEIHKSNADTKAAEDYSSSSGFNFKKGSALFVGPSFGDATNINVGLRSYHTFSNSSLMFTPDIYVGFGSKFAFGVNANGMLPFSINSDLTPYVGAGIGLNYINSKLKFAPNFIGGISKKIGTTSVYLEYTARGAFKNNQIALGYRFKF